MENRNDKKQNKLIRALKYFNAVEWTMWSASIVAIIVGFFVFGNTQYHYLVGSIIGITSLAFVSKGNPVGQIFIIIFSVFYGVISFSFKYYGEMITYLCMSAPIAVVSLVMWLKNPFEGNKSEVKVNGISKKEWGIFAAAAAVVTTAFYFILRALGTQNLWVSSFRSFLRSDRLRQY